MEAKEYKEYMVTVGFDKDEEHKAQIKTRVKALSSLDAAMICLSHRKSEEDESYIIGPDTRFALICERYEQA